MKKHSDNTPTFEPGTFVKVGEANGRVECTLEDGRIMVKLDNGLSVPAEPDKVTQQ